jgi:hypothetical protein
MDKLLKVFFKSKKWMLIGLVVLIVFGGVIGFIVFKPNPNTDDVITVGRAGGTIYADTEALDGFNIVVPEAAYLNDVSFNITSEPFTNNNVPELFEAASPLIHIDNNHVIAETPLTVTIPIDIDTNTEFAMAFYYDKTTESFEAIPTLSLTNEEIQIITTHFSSIVVSKVRHTQLFDLVFQSPEKFDSGFTAGVDDFPFKNYGSELAKSGHCGGQSLAMMWYYTERKLKHGDESLYTRFDEDTPNFWIDDTRAYRLASILQDTFDFNSPQFDFYFDLLKSADEERFFSVAYSLYMTRKPQLFAVYRLNDNNKIVSGHALVVNKITYDMVQYKIHIVDPNYSGDTTRHIFYDENTGFGTYFSGSNATDIANNKGVYYSEIAHIGQSALTDYKQIQKEYDRVLNHTIGDTEFSSVDIEYYQKTTNNTYRWVKLPQTLTYEGVAIDEVITNKQIGIRVIGRWQANRATIFKNQNELFYSDTTDWGALEFIIDLDKGINHIGVLYEQLSKKVFDGPYYPHYNGYYAFEITLDADEPIVYDWDDIKQSIPGQYVEIERSSGVINTYPNVEINISEIISDDTSIVLFDHGQQSIYQSGRWYASNAMNGYEPGTPVIIADLFFSEDIHYVIDPYNQTLTLTFTNGETITYEKKPAATYVYYYQHRIDMYNVSGNVYDYHYAEITTNLSYTQQWKIDMLIPDGNTGQDELLIITNNPYFRRVISDSRSIYTSTRGAKGIDSYYFNLTHGDQFTLNIDIYEYQSGDWVLSETKTIQITVDFTK